jgi:hypothetical protein
MFDVLYKACWVVIGLAGVIVLTMMIFGLLGVGD